MISRRICAASGAIIPLLLLFTSCGGQKGTRLQGSNLEDDGIVARAYLYDLRMSDSGRSRSARAELYAAPDRSVMRVKGALGTLGAVVLAYHDTLAIFLPRQKNYVLMPAESEHSDDSCRAIREIWQLLVHPSMTEPELDSLRAWTIVNAGDSRKQLLWQEPRCGLTVTAKTASEQGHWFFEELDASGSNGTVSLRLRERREEAIIPRSRLRAPDTTGWGMLRSADLDFPLD